MQKGRTDLISATSSKDRQEHGLIRDLETASAHDSMVDLSQHRDVVYRDRATRSQAQRVQRYHEEGQPGPPVEHLGLAEEQGDKPEEGSRGCPFAVLKRVFGDGHVLMTTVPRVHESIAFSCLCFNLLHMSTLAIKS